jgi:hypothetical protein
LNELLNRGSKAEVALLLSRHARQTSRLVSNKDVLITEYDVVFLKFREDLFSFSYLKFRLVVFNFTRYGKWSVS